MKRVVPTCSAYSIYVGQIQVPSLYYVSFLRYHRLKFSSTYEWGLGLWSFLFKGMSHTEETWHMCRTCVWMCVDGRVGGVKIRRRVKIRRGVMVKKRGEVKVRRGASG